MQFADGGSIEAHARRVMEAQAIAAQGHTAHSVGVAAVHRDAQGGLWWDADEEMEYAPLLDAADDDGAAEADWEEFDGDALSPLPGSPRRSPHHHRRPARGTHEHLDAGLRTRPPRASSRCPSSRTRARRTTASSRPRRIGGPGMSVLALPARPRRAVPHLRAAPAFLVDAAAFVPRSPRWRRTGALFFPRTALPAEGPPPPPPRSSSRARRTPCARGAWLHIPLLPLRLCLLLHARSPPWMLSRVHDMNSSRTRSPQHPPRASSLSLS